MVPTALLNTACGVKTSSFAVRKSHPHTRTSPRVQASTTSCEVTTAYKVTQSPPKQGIRLQVSGWRQSSPCTRLSIDSWLSLRRLRPQRSQSATVVAMSSKAPESEFTVVNGRNEKLAGLLVDAGDDTDVVIMCHGFMSHKNNTRNMALYPKLAERGVSSVRFDFAGNGSSEGEFDFGDYHREVEDLRYVVEAVRAKGRKVRAIMGHSKGGNTVLLYASKYDDVPLVCNVCGRFDVQSGVEERFGPEGLERMKREGRIEQPLGDTKTYTVTYESLQKRLNTDMKAAVKGINNTRIVTIHGTEDEIIPVEDAHEYNKVIKNHTMIIVNGADHRFHAEEHCRELIQHLLDHICPTT